MAAILLDEGLPGTLKAKWAQTGSLAAGAVGLYTAISPALDKNTVLANFTAASGMGYSAKSIGSGDGAFALDGTNHWETATFVYTWTFTAGAGMTILGYYVIMSGGAKAMLAEQFASSVVIPAGGGSLQLTIVDKYKDCV